MIGIMNVNLRRKLFNKIINHQKNLVHVWRSIVKK